jgi:hypothetical protein
MTTKHHYVFLHSSSSTEVRFDDTFFVIANYETTGTNGVQTSDLVTYYANALSDSTYYNGSQFNDQLGNSLLSAVPIGQFSDESTRGSANLNVIEVRAEGSSSSTISELIQEVATARTGTTVSAFSTAISNIDQTSTASVNLSVLSGTSGDYEPLDEYSNENSSTGGSGQLQGISHMTQSVYDDRVFAYGPIRNTVYEQAMHKANDRHRANASFWNQKAIADIVNTTDLEACFTDPSIHTINDGINEVQENSYFSLTQFAENLDVLDVYSTGQVIGLIVKMLIDIENGTQVSLALKHAIADMQTTSSTNNLNIIN